jgi:hypothetical protein
MTRYFVFGCQVKGFSLALKNQCRPQRKTVFYFPVERRNRPNGCGGSAFSKKFQENAKKMRA